MSDGVFKQLNKAAPPKRIIMVTIGTGNILMVGLNKAVNAELGKA